MWKDEEKIERHIKIERETNGRANVIDRLQITFIKVKRNTHTDAQPGRQLAEYVWMLCVSFNTWNVN